MRRVGFHGGYHGGEGVLDFSVNLNPLGPPPGFLEKANRCLESLRRYPDPEYEELRKELASFYKADPEFLVPVNGASEGLFATVVALRARSIVTVSPTYGEEDFRLLASVLGGRVAPHIMAEDRERFRVNPDSLLDTIRRMEPPVVIYMSNPNNPTGSRIPQAAIAEVAEEIAGRGVVLVDEAYEEISTGEHRVRNPHPGVIIARSLTKYLSLPGLRLGFLYTREAGLAEKIWRVLPPWNIGSLTDCAVRLLLRNRKPLSSFIRETARIVTTERNRLTMLLRRAGYRVYKSRANYLLLRHDWTTTVQLVEYALKRGIYLRRADNFWGLNSRYTRVSIRRPEENDALVRVLEDARLDLG